MGFGEAVITCLSKYFGFSGRARRSEYWWFTLFYTIFPIGVAIVEIAVLGGVTFGFVTVMVFIALMIPGVTVSVRRFHDLDKTGWWILINFVPFIGVFVFLYFMIQKGTEGPNSYGDDPLGRYDGAPETEITA